MSISPIFDTARRALAANETALGVVSNNIANANTDGYTRQVVDFAADRATLVGGAYVGRGVHIDAIRQVLDPFVDQRLRRAQTEQSGLGAESDELQRLSATLGDLQSPSLTDQVTAFFDSVDALARNPAGLAERQTVLGRAQALAVELNRRSAAVAGLQRSVDGRIGDAIAGANQAIDDVAHLNQLIVAREAGGAGPANDLRDERARALGTLADALGVEVQERDDGSTRIVARDGTVLVEDGAVLHHIAVQNGATGLDTQPLQDFGFMAGGTFVARPDAFAAGTIGRLAAVRDGALPQASANLDTVANALRTAVNGVQQAGFDLDGNPTTAVPLFGGTGAADLAVAITDPRQLAAAGSAQPGDNTNALAMADLRTTPLGALGGMSFGSWLATEQGRIGESASVADDAAKSAKNFSSQLELERNNLSGVNVNEELVNLIRYQRAFQATAQVINVANTMLDNLFSIGT